MLAKLQERRDKDEGGFTLIELMVVVLIIAILVAIAVPTFMGARTRAQDRSAQSTARNALTTARVLFTDDGDYGTNIGAGEALAARMASIDGGLTFQATASTDASEVSMSGTDSADADTDYDVVFIAVLSDSGTCYMMQDNNNPLDTTATGGGVSYGSFQSTANSCVGTATNPAGGWSQVSGW
ncbi:MAG: type IV pilus assembly protein PilA [Candidatus Poriferisodalaceae bacterium]|jgi:type IV pilus assembly protein PilA